MKVISLRCASDWDHFQELGSFLTEVIQILGFQEFDFATKRDSGRVDRYGERGGI